MSTLVPNSFSTYSLTAEELAVGSQLTELNLRVIQNLISESAEEKLALKYDPQNPLAFVQREAELQGQIGVLKYLVAQHQENLSHNLQLNLNSEGE